MIEKTSIPELTEADLKMLAVFRVVAEAGGFSAAENQLGMERSTISRHIQSLELRLGARLCNRGPSGFELTDFGKVALRASMVARDTIDTLRDELNMARNIVTGEVRLGVVDNSMTNPFCQLVPAIKSFQLLAPRVRLDIRVRTTQQIIADLLARKIHLGIIVLPPGDSRFLTSSLFTEEFRLYCSPSRSSVATVLTDIEEGRTKLVIRDHDRHSLALVKGISIEETAFASGLEAVATFIASGGYVGFLPTHYVAASPIFSEFMEVEGASKVSYKTQFSAIVERNRPESPGVALFRKELIKAHAASRN